MPEWASPAFQQHTVEIAFQHFDHHAVVINGFTLVSSRYKHFPVRRHTGRVDGSHHAPALLSSKRRYLAQDIISFQHTYSFYGNISLRSNDPSLFFSNWLSSKEVVEKDQQVPVRAWSLIFVAGLTLTTVEPIGRTWKISRFSRAGWSSFLCLYRQAERMDDKCQGREKDAAIMYNDFYLCEKISGKPNIQIMYPQTQTGCCRITLDQDQQTVILFHREWHPAPCINHLLFFVFVTLMIVPGAAWL